MLREIHHRRPEEDQQHGRHPRALEQPAGQKRPTATQRQLRSVPTTNPLRSRVGDHSRSFASMARSDSSAGDRGIPAMNTRRSTIRN